MRVLLVSPYIASESDAGLFVAKALSELGHSLVLWDCFLTNKPPTKEYDLALVLKWGDTKKLTNTKVNWFPDNFVRFVGIDDYIKQFDYFFTINKEDKGIWLPGALDEDFHKPINAEKVFDVCFLGTANSPKKAKFIKLFMRKFKGRFGVFGNDWGKYGIKAYPPQRSLGFTNVMSSAKIALNLHWDLYGKGTNRKVHEISGCGSAMLLTDNVEGLGEIYPMAPNFNSLTECLELADYYLENRKERLELVKKMQKQAYEKFTYKKQIEKMLEMIKT
ncbi:MAG: glycosyltransferase family 1 protein [Thermoplasmatales archaeon]|nr:glycosyltransferase family 1 protein [Thermoplasmatales archaeon]